MLIYQWTLPRQPDPAIGRIYPLNIYGPEVYLTRKEQDSLYRRQWSSGRDSRARCFALQIV